MKVSDAKNGAMYLINVCKVRSLFKDDNQIWRVSWI